MSKHHRVLDRNGRPKATLAPSPSNIGKFTRVELSAPTYSPVTNSCMPNAPQGYDWPHLRTPPRG